MNEEELKEIWKAETASAPKINFEALEKNALSWQERLRRKIKIDILTNAAAYVLLLPLVYFLPAILYLTPVFILVWVWYLWETLRLYRHETNFSGQTSTREYLSTKKSFLENYISRTRWIAYLAAMPCALAGIYISGYFNEVLRVPLILAAVLIFIQISTVVIVELYVRKAYAPSVYELNDLLRQLNAEDVPPASEKANQS